MNVEQRRLEGQEAIAFRQRRGQSARFLVYSDRIEKWAENNTCCWLACIAVVCLGLGAIANHFWQ